MEDQILDSSFAQQDAPQANNFVYSTFWTRLAAVFLDGIIVGIIGTCLIFVGILNTDLYYAMVPLQLAFGLFYFVYLLQAKGATPGKMAMNLKIIKTDGTPVDLKAAFLRYLPNLIIALANLVITLASVSAIDPEVYEELSWFQKMQHLATINPKATSIIQYGYWAWFVIDTIVFFSNKEKRALHDKIAETVVISTR